MLTSLGQIASRRHEFARARGFLEEALALRTRLLGEQHPNVAETILMLAQLAEADGDFARARSLFERALVIRVENTKADAAKRQDGRPGDPADPQFAALLEQVGRLLLQIGDHAAASTQFQRAAAIRRSLAASAQSRAGFEGFGRRSGHLGSRTAFMGPFGMGGDDAEEESPTRQPPSLFGLGLEDDDLLGQEDSALISECRSVDLEPTAA